MAKPEAQPKEKIRDFPSRYRDSLYQLILLKDRPKYQEFFNGWSAELCRVARGIQDWNTRFPPHTGIFQGIADGMGLEGDKEDPAYWALMADIAKVIDPFLKECQEKFGLRFMFPLARPSLEYLPELLDPQKDLAGIPEITRHILISRLLHSYDSHKTLEKTCLTWGRETPYSTYTDKEKRIDPDFDGPDIYGIKRMGYTFKKIAEGMNLGLSSVKDKYQTYISYINAGEKYNRIVDRVKVKWSLQDRKYAIERCQRCELRYPGIYEYDDEGSRKIVKIHPDVSIGELCAARPEYRRYVASDGPTIDNRSICSVIDYWVKHDRPRKDMLDARGRVGLDVVLLADEGDDEDEDAVRTPGPTRGFTGTPWAIPPGVRVDSLIENLRNNPLSRRSYREIRIWEGLKQRKPIPNNYRYLG